MESFQRLESLIPFHREDLSPLTLSEPAVLSALKRFNPKKVAGPVGVPNWLLKEYEDILVCPVTAVLNSYCSFAARDVRHSWRWPMLPTSTNISVRSPLVALHVGHAVLEVIDPNQYIWWHSSVLQRTLMSMLHTWLQANRGSGTAVRVELFDYKKALVFFSFIPSNFGLP